MRTAYAFALVLVYCCLCSNLWADGSLASRTASIADFLSHSEGSLNGSDRQRISNDILRIENLLDFYGYQQSGPRLFKLKQDGDKLEVYSAKTNSISVTQT